MRPVLFRESLFHPEQSGLPPIAEWGHLKGGDSFSLAEGNLLAQLTGKSGEDRPDAVTTVFAAQQLHQQALELIEKKRFKQAIALLEKAILREPRSPAIRITLANAYFGLERYRDAVRVYQDALVLGGGPLAQDNPRIYFRLVVALQKLGETDEMLETLAEATTTVVPGNPELWALRAKTLYDLGRKDAAVSVLREGIEHNPLEATLHFDLGVVLANQERYNEARQEFEEVLLIDPARQEVKKYLGEIGRAVTGVTARFPEDLLADVTRDLIEKRSLEEIKALLEKRPSIEERKRIATKLLWSGRPLDVIALLGEGEEQHADDARYSRILGEAYLAVQRFDNAIDAFRRVLKIERNNIRVMRMLETALEEKGRRLRREEIPKLPTPGE